MRNSLAALLLSTALLACTKTPDPAPSAAPAADPTPAPNNAPAAAAPAPTQATAPASADPTPAPSTGAVAADSAAPDLVEAAPGVQVVADYDAPVFFNSGMYWRYNDGGWYSSSEYTGGWAYRASPPSVIVNIDHPERFVHFKPSGYVARRRPAPQREWHPEPVRAEVRVDPHAQVRVDPHAEVPRAQVRVDEHAEVRTAPVVVKPQPVERDHRN
jgi:hypothetical protein